MGLNINKLIFFALAKTGVGISGSDRIFIELARNWSKTYRVEIITSSEGSKLCKIQDLKGKYLDISSINNKKYEDYFSVNYLYKIFKSLHLGLTLKVANEPTVIMYSSSDFWMDVFPAILLKLRFPQTKWVATWYQTAPNPLKGFGEGSRENTYNLSALWYWLSQLPIKPLINRFANYVIVNNEDERKQFPLFNKRNKLLVLIGAVRLDEIEKYLKDNNRKVKQKKYHAVFQGRFHPQKGVVELVDIWKKVTEKIPEATLVMIGDGPLMEDVKKKIKTNKLDKNIFLFGYVYDGIKKYELFSSSKLVVHPAFYDSGGMASAEAMAFGIPCIGFNLKAYESYYPSGMIKVKIGDLDAFANKITALLEDDKKRNDLGKIAKRMVYEGWSWEERANNLLSKLANAL